VVWIYVPETGIIPVSQRERSSTEEEEVTSQTGDTGGQRPGSGQSIDLEWDSDTEFTAADDIDTQTLIRAQAS